MEMLSKQIEQTNQENILRCIERMDRVSRAGIAKQLGLSRTTVSAAVSRLAELKLVREDDAAEEPALGRGRPGIPVVLTTNVWYAAGAAFIDQQLLFVLSDLYGNAVEKLTLPVPDGCAETFLSVLTQGFSQLIARCPGKLLPMLGVGTPGMVNEGCICVASDMGWENVRVAEHIQRTLGYPSIVVNRNWASCMGEWQFGAGKGVSNLIYVGFNTGIAASIIIDGKLFTGAYHSAGEIGHTIVNRNGPLCNCGRRGCLHAYASERALLRRVSEYYAQNPAAVCAGDPLWAMLSHEQPLTVDAICRAAVSGQPVALETLNKAALYIGLSIGNLISMFNPQRVIVGGSFIDHAGRLLTDMIVDSVREHASPDSPVAVEITPWTLGRFSGPLGAALLVLERKRDLATAALVE